MALFKIFKGDSGRLETNRPQRQEGFIYLTEDSMKFYIDTQTSVNTTANSLTQAEKEYRQPLNASKSDLLQSWETNPADNPGEWTVNIPDITASKLKDGLTIRIRIMTNYNSSYNTLNINGLGAKLVYFRYDSLLTSHLPRYAEMVLTYRTAHNVGSTVYTGASASARTIGGINYGTDGWVLDSSYSDGNTYDRLLNSAEMRRAGQSLTGEKLCMLDVNNLLQPVSIGNTTDATKTANTTPLQIPRIIYYARSASATAVAAYGIINQNTLYEDVPFDPRRTINATVDPYCDLYLVGTINSSGLFVLDSSSKTSFYKIVSQPSSSSLANNTFTPGKYYLYVGSSRNASNLVHLMPHNQLYTCLDQTGKTLVAVTPYAITSLGDLGSMFEQTITSGTESGKITLNGVQKSIYYGRPQSAQWKATDTELKFEIINTDDSSALSTAMPTIKVAWGGTGTTSLDLGKAIIGNGTNAVTFRDIYTRTSVGTLDWSAVTNEYLVTKGAIAYWNGAYSGTSSNLAYYKHGAFGTIATANKTDWAKNYLLYTSDTNVASTTTSLYSNGSNLGIGVVGVTSGYILEVGGKAKFNQDTLFKKPVIFEDTIRVDKLGTFKAGLNITGNITFPSANMFDWNDGTYRQRLVITDDSTANTAVFTFQQSSDSGSNYKNLMVIKDNGEVIADYFVGNGSKLTDLNMDAASSGTLAVTYGGTGRKKHTKNSVLFGNDASPIESATHVKVDNTHLTVGQETVDTTYTFRVTGQSYFSDNINMKAPSAGANSNKIVFTGGTDGADIYYSLPTNNNGILVLNVKDDGEERIGFAFKDTVKIYARPNDITFYPATTNTGSLGLTSNRWAHVYIGTDDSYGANDRPIYWNDGVPIQSTANVGSAENPMYLKAGVFTKCTYTISATVKAGTKPRLAYYSGNNEISSAPQINYLNNVDVTYNSQTMKQNGLRIWGTTYGNTANQLKSNNKGHISFGDGGPQIQFGTSETGGQQGALIYTDHDACGAGASFHFVSGESDWNVHSRRFVADVSMTIGDYVPNTSYNLYVGGTVYISNTTYIGGKTTIANQLIAKYDQDFISHSNEFNFIPKLTSDMEIHINHRQLGSNGSGVITKYHFKNGAGAYTDLYMKNIVGTGTLTMQGTQAINTTSGKTLAIWDGSVLKKIDPNNMVNTIFRLYTYTASLKLTQDWQDVGITNATEFSTIDSLDKKLDSGSYIIQVYVNGAGTSGTTNSYQETYTGVMSWFKDMCNSTDADEIVLHKAGHASAGHNIYLRTIRQASTASLKLQIKCSKTCTANENIVFKLRKMI